MEISRTGSLSRALISCTDHIFAWLVISTAFVNICILVSTVDAKI